MALDQILNLTQADIVEQGKAIDTEEDEPDIASKFSGIERMAAQVGDASISMQDQECYSSTGKTTIHRISTQIVNP